MCLPIIGAIVSGIGSVVGLAAQAASYSAQADYQRRQAQIELETGAYAAKQKQKEVNAVLGTQRAVFGASGLDLMSGTPSDVYTGSAQEGALDVAAIRWNSQLAGDNFNAQAKISDMNASNTMAAAPFAFLTPVISNFASISPKFV